MSRLADAVVQFLESRDWPVDVDDSMIRTVVRTEEQAFPLAAVVVDSVGQIVVYSVHPDPVPPERRDAVAELATRANSQLTVGNLELELDAGQVRFRTGLAVGQSPITEEMVERVIFDNAATAVAYFPLVSAVVEGRLAPAEAVSLLGDDGG
ncbi:MAG: YbjN domain-containing protein [Acidimicrobiales bacterium]